MWFFRSFAFASEPSKMASLSRKPCVLVILVCTNFSFLTGFLIVSGFVLYRLGHISAAVRCTARQLIHLTDAKFDVEPQLCLPCCKTNGGAVGEGDWPWMVHRFGQSGSGRLPWDRQRKGCLGSIRKRSQSRSADMHNTTCARLEGPHFLIAEIWPNRQVMENSQKIEYPSSRDGCSIFCELLHEGLAGSS